MVLYRFGVIIPRSPIQFDSQQKSTFLVINRFYRILQFDVAPQPHSHIHVCICIKQLQKKNIKKVWKYCQESLQYDSLFNFQSD